VDRRPARASDAGASAGARTAEPEDSPMTRTYARVLVVEVVVLLALWGAGRYFAAP
jgi:hypothetical protein